MRVFLILLLLACQSIPTSVFAEDPTDTYFYRSRCPKDEGDYITREGEKKRVAGGILDTTDEFVYVSSTQKQRWDDLSYFIDKWKFAQCNCTSYVASKLNEAWGGTSPVFNNSYYGQRWGNGSHWLNAARASEIGVTGARDRFTFEKSRFNGAFKGDVAIWEAWGELKDKDGNVIRTANPYGHVAFVEEDGEPDGTNNGVKCVQISEYNWNSRLNFGRRAGSTKVCKSTDPNDVKFPHYFAHVTQDRVYCLANPTMGLCSRISGQTATSDTKYYGVFGGAGSDTFNLKVNSFGTWAVDGTQLTPDVSKVTTGQIVTLKVQVKASNGATSSHMRPGKSSIEVDIYVRQDNDDWVFLKREHIQAVNLPSGATHTESITYVVPSGVNEVSFKAKIDAEDEAYEANEGDNWTEIQTFQVDFSWLIPILNLLLND